MSWSLPPMLGEDFSNSGAGVLVSLLSTLISPTVHFRRTHLVRIPTRLLLQKTTARGFRIVRKSQKGNRVFLFTRCDVRWPVGLRGFPDERHRWEVRAFDRHRCSDLDQCVFHATGFVPKVNQLQTPSRRIPSWCVPQNREFGFAGCVYFSWERALDSCAVCTSLRHFCFGVLLRLQNQRVRTIKRAIALSIRMAASSKNCSANLSDCTSETTMPNSSRSWSKRPDWSLPVRSSETMSGQPLKRLWT